jgi:hypothetical protein
MFTPSDQSGSLAASTSIDLDKPVGLEFVILTNAMFLGLDSAQGCHLHHALSDYWKGYRIWGAW